MEALLHQRLKRTGDMTAFLQAGQVGEGASAGMHAKQAPECNRRRARSPQRRPPAPLASSWFRTFDHDQYALRAAGGPTAESAAIRHRRPMARSMACPPTPTPPRPGPAAAASSRSPKPPSALLPRPQRDEPRKRAVEPLR